MLSDPTLGYLSTLTYRPDAQRQVCWLPLSGICWEDEMTKNRLATIPEDDLKQILRLFGIRVRCWRGEDLTAAEQQVWDAIHLRVPTWAFFHRQQISADDLLAQEDAEHAATDLFEALFADADELIINEQDGVQRYSATFYLTGEQPVEGKKRSWWKRVLSRRRV